MRPRDPGDRIAVVGPRVRRTGVRVACVLSAIAFLAATSAMRPLGAQDVRPAEALPSITLPPDLDRVLRDYERAWRAGDVPALVALFTEAGFVLQPGRPPARGHAALAEVYRGQGGRPLRLRALADAVDGADGRWRSASDLDNGNRPPRPPPSPPPPPAGGG
jgi:hypothetical protein